MDATDMSFLNPPTEEEQMAEHVATLTTMLKRNRQTIQRRDASATQARQHQNHYIREALEVGMLPKKVARLTGLTEGRISQIRNEFGPTVSMFDAM